MLRDGLRYDKQQKKIKHQQQEEEQPGGVFVREDEDEKDDENDETCLRDHIVLATPYSAKGLEYKYGYIVSLHAQYWPDKREPDLDSERRSLYVAITRYSETLTIYNSMGADSSIFINELAEKGLLRSLFDTRLLSFSGVDGDQDDDRAGEVVDTDDKRVALTLTKAHELEIIGGWEDSISRLNGCGYRALERDILQKPLPLYTRTVPLMYVFPPPPAEQQHEEQSHKRRKVDHQVHDDDETEDEDLKEDSDDEDVIDIDPEQEDPEEDVRSFQHSQFVQSHHMETEFEQFLDCWSTRFLQQLKVEYNRVPRGLYEYVPGNQAFVDMKRRSVHLAENKLKSIYFHYKEYKNMDNTWRACLLSIYWTSTFSAVRTGNLGVMYVPMSKARLLEYTDLLDEMERVIHYLVYGQTYHNDNGYTCPDWHVREFHYLKQTRVPTPYVLVGKRLIILNNSNTEFGISFESLLKGIGYACIERVVHKNTIENVEVYNAFARRLCTLDVKEWKQDKQFMKFVQEADRRVFEL